MAREPAASAEDEHRVVRFRPRQVAENRRRSMHRLMIERDFAELSGRSLNGGVQFEHEHEETEGEYRHRMFISGLAFLINIFLIVVGLLLITNLR